MASGCRAGLLRIYQEVFMEFTIPLPTYQCHKRVQALRIMAVIETPRGLELHFEDERFVPMQVSKEWVFKALVEKFLPASISSKMDWSEFVSDGNDYQKISGCYVVWHDNSDVSIYPAAAAFEAGYTLVKDTPC